jgi:SAM-dependent methyltransferase
MRSKPPTASTNALATPRDQRAAQEASFFDRHVATYGAYEVLGDAGYERLMRAFERCVGPKPGQRCIDMGCGTGAVTRRLRRFGLELEGMDLSPAAIEIARRSAQSERYSCGDVMASGLPDACCDIIVYSGVLHHFPTAADRAKVLDEGFRLLVPGGKLFAFDPNRHSIAMWLYRDPRSPFSSRAGLTDNEVLLSRAELRNELSRAGFSQVDVRGIGGITFTHAEGATARALLPLYNLSAQLVRYSPLQNMLGTMLVSFAVKA